MVTITNGIVTNVVTRGAYECIFKGMGYKIVDDGKSYTDMYLDAKEDADNAIDSDKKFINELSEKPISEWDKEEVKKFASIKGIDIHGTKSITEAKNIIKSFMEKE